MRWFFAMAAALALAGCTHSSGERADTFLNPTVAAAYIPLEGSAYLLMEGHGAGVAIGPDLAVTNAHNRNLIDDDQIIGESKNYDLLFFKTPQAAKLVIAKPYVNERVLAYGQGKNGDLRVAQGTVKWLDAEVIARCKDCTVQKAFIFEANAGPGFSGGPVVDAQSGQLLGIVFGFQDEEGGDVEKQMYAYDMARVNVELANIRSHPGHPAQ
ncbi:MAG TPA: trypsin-like peptidase domain-containing protein [Rhizomicrobium sp.]|nr:trypsin-like peptidase domain-containing protein [Rhizomicrobium sp.]